MPALDDPRVMRAMSEIEQGMDQLDENNPRHMAMLLRKMQAVMPAGAVPKDFDVAIRRLEAGEDPEKIEADMGDVLAQWMGGDDKEGGGVGGGEAGRGTVDYTITRSGNDCPGVHGGGRFDPYKTWNMKP